MQVDVTLVTLAIFFIVAIIIILISGVRIVQPYEQGLWIVLGRYRHKLNPGFNWVYPMISQVIKLDLRTQVLDVPRQEVITKDNSPTNVDAVIYIKIIDPEKSFFEVANYKLATVALAQTTLRSILGDMELDEILYNRDTINTRLRDILDQATDGWGVKVEAVEIREVDPVGRVKAAMEEQTSAERTRRAAILIADGEKRSAILKAEGGKRSRVLEAEGLRQAKILEAQGERMKQILERQGEAQGLRILALGSAELDARSLTVLSLDALKKLGEGEATKIVLPFEVSSLMRSAGAYIRGGIDPETATAKDWSSADLEKSIGKPDDILGPIPSHEEIKHELEQVEAMTAAEEQTAAEIAALAKRKAAPREPEEI
ncbi:MAG: SPFH/Band 7/PHB domain protein [Euryarchaeota archaeon]|nr:SPFH/Band 7/PHB domain protein [Euryarchaeota archaeon]